MTVELQNQFAATSFDINRASAKTLRQVVVYNSAVHLIFKMNVVPINLRVKYNSVRGDFSIQNFYVYTPPQKRSHIQCFDHILLNMALI